MKKVLAKYGGEEFLNSAVNYANNSPKIRNTLNKFGTSPNQLRKRVLQELEGERYTDNHDVVTKNKSDVSSYKNRLDKMR